MCNSFPPGADQGLGGMSQLLVFLTIQDPVEVTKSGYHNNISSPGLEKGEQRAGHSGI